MNNDNISTEFLSVNQFAKKVGLHPNTIKKYIREGCINAIKFGSHARSPYRIPISEVNRIGLFSLKEIVDKIVEKKNV